MYIGISLHDELSQGIISGLALAVMTLIIKYIIDMDAKTREPLSTYFMYTVAGVFIYFFLVHETVVMNYAVKACDRGDREACEYVDGDYLSY